MFAAIPSPTQSQFEVGPLTFHFYALCIILGVVAAVLIGNRRYVAIGGKSGVVGDVAVFAVPAGVIGGRLYHVITSPEKYFGVGGDPIAILFIWQGGLGIWGAISLGFAAAYIAYRRHPQNSGIEFSRFADALAPALLVAQALGRWGNWFNKELFGRPLEAPWALEIPLAYRPIGYSSYETFHPVFLYESLWCLAVAAFLMFYPKLRNLNAGGIFALYVALYSFGRGLIELIRIDESNLILGVRLNIFTSALLVLGGAIYLFRHRNFQSGKTDHPQGSE
ncbi:MAG: prolipoprotein diacylglyceryl transferase [Candidatus Nanopelagicaceae bacterium]|nr:prolipoprotein diacylglyceryl transferase [Candidatus Nanopelagicaceae bacterium]